MKFQLLAGTYEGHKKGDVFDSDLPLDTMFINKFARRHDVERAIETALSEVAPAKKKKSATTEEQPATEDASDASHGDDVTSDFPQAVSRKLSVFSVKKGFDVYDGKTRMNDKPLKTAKKVNELIEAL